MGIDKLLTEKEIIAFGKIVLVWSYWRDEIGEFGKDSEIKVFEDYSGRVDAFSIRVRREEITRYNLSTDYGHIRTYHGISIDNYYLSCWAGKTKLGDYAALDSLNSPTPQSPIRRFFDRVSKLSNLEIERLGKSPTEMIKHARRLIPPRYIQYKK